MTMRPRLRALERALRAAVPPPSLLEGVDVSSLSEAEARILLIRSLDEARPLARGLADDSESMTPARARELLAQKE